MSSAALIWISMLGMRNVTFTKEEPLKMNAQPNKIKMPGKTDKYKTK